MQKDALHILYVASWYPNRNAPALGNFIQRHAQAASITNTISVVYAVSDKKIADGQIELVETHNGNLSEYVLYFGKINSTVPIISQLKKRDVYRNAIRKGVEAAMQKNGTPSLIHVHVIWPAAIGVLPLLQELKVPVIISEHWSGYLPEDGNYKGIVQKNISKQLAEKAIHVTVVSKRMEEALKQHGLGKSFSLLPNAIDTSIFNQRPETRNKKPLKLLHVSMLVDREKNISGLLNVMKNMAFTSNIPLQIIGDGPQRKEFENFAAENGLLNKSVFFSGYKSPAEIAKAMQHSLALILFSNFEGMPVTILEAQCCGLPVIATRTGSIPAMVNETNGILVDVGDEAGLEKAILQVKENHSHYSTEEISNKAISKYSLNAVGKQLDELYKKIISQYAR